MDAAATRQGQTISVVLSVLQDDVIFCDFDGLRGAEREVASSAKPQLGSSRSHGVLDLPLAGIPPGQ